MVRNRRSNLDPLLAGDSELYSTVEWQLQTLPLSIWLTAKKLTESKQSILECCRPYSARKVMDKHEILSNTTFGQRVAEDETDALVSYFVETDHWKRIYKGEVDIVYGMKGAGKSAIYSLLLSKKQDFFLKEEYFLSPPRTCGELLHSNILPPILQSSSGSSLASGSYISQPCYMTC